MSTTGFSEDSRVVVEQLDDERWAVRQPFSYRGQRDTYEIYDGMQTDFASVPRPFVWFLPRYGRYTRAAIVHDLLWREWASQNRMDWIDADGIFRRAMRELGVPFLRRWIMWAAVRWGALFKPNGLRRWWREAPRVLLVTILAAPIVVPPGLLILVAMAIFYVLEQLVWVALKLAQVVRNAIRRPSDKEVNAPGLCLKL
jgi:Protein of unknown function (DUF1353)